MLMFCRLNVAPTLSSLAQDRRLRFDIIPAEIRGFGYFQSEIGLKDFRLDPIDVRIPRYEQKPFKIAFVSPTLRTLASYDQNIASEVDADFVRVDPGDMKCEVVFALI